MADSTIQVLEGLFATPIMAEDEYGNPVGAVETGVTATGLTPTFSTLTAKTTVPSAGVLIGLGLLYWLFLRK